jgi:F-type H+-transporting ATPase subunit a
MDVTPDAIMLWQMGPVKINATIAFTWLVMGLLILVSWIATRKISTGSDISRLQNLLETIISYTRNQIKEITGRKPDLYLPFIATLFLFISVSNLLAIVPGYQPPTGSISTTSGLAICVFFAVPIFGIAERGVVGYLKHYIRPTPLMLPFQVIAEFSRTLALAVRLFGNVMSGTLIVAILVSIVPFVLPVIMQALGLLLGQIHAYIFAILATVYIGSAIRIQEQEEAEQAADSGRQNSNQSGKGE